MRGGCEPLATSWRERGIRGSALIAGLGLWLLVGIGVGHAQTGAHYKVAPDSVEVTAGHTSPALVLRVALDAPFTPEFPVEYNFQVRVPSALAGKVSVVPAQPSITLHNGDTGGASSPFRLQVAAGVPAGEYDFTIATVPAPGGTAIMVASPSIVTRFTVNVTGQAPVSVKAVTAKPAGKGSVRLVPSSLSLSSGQSSSSLRFELEFPEPVSSTDLKEVHVTMPSQLLGNTRVDPLPLTYRVGKAPTKRATATFRVVTTPATPSGTWRIGFEDWGYELGTADLVLTVRPAGDIAVRFEPSELSLCAGGQSAHGELVLQGLEGYRGTPSVRWSGWGPGLTIQPSSLPRRSLPPDQRIGFDVSASAAATSTSNLAVRVEDPAAGVSHDASLTLQVTAPDFTPRVPEGIELPQGGSLRTFQLSIDPNPCFGNRSVQIQLGGGPTGLFIQSPTTPLTAPAYVPISFQLKALPAVQVGNYQLKAVFTADGLPVKTMAIPFAVTAPGREELLRAPFVDQVAPDRLERGKQYELELRGRNLRPGTRLSFGKDIQLLAPPFFKSPTRATVRVMVPPVADLGVHAATVENSDGKNEGPGGVLVEVAAPSAVATPPQVQPKLPPLDLVHFQHGVIDLLAPMWRGPSDCSVEICTYSYPVFDDDVRFEWKERNPGVADWFELRILQAPGGGVLATRRLDPQNLEMPSVGGGSSSSTLTVLPTYLRPDAAMVAGVVQKMQPGRPMSRQQQEAGWQVQAMSSKVVPALGGSGASGEGGASPAPSTASEPAPDLYWEVVGYKRYGGGAAAKGVEVERSPRGKLRVPLKPNGFAVCGAGDMSSGLNLVNVSSKTSKTESGGRETDVNNYPGDRIELSGKIDLSRAPYASHPEVQDDPAEAFSDAYAQWQSQMNSALGSLGPFGGSGGSSPQSQDVKLKFADAYQFDNLFVDWGDGTVEPLKLKATGSQFDYQRGEPLELPKQWTQHRYQGTGSFEVRVYLLSESDVQKINAAQLSEAQDGAQINPYFAIRRAGSVAVPGLADRQSGTSPPAGAAALRAGSPSQMEGSASLPPGARPSLSKAATGGLPAEIAGRAFVIFCKSVVVSERRDPAATGPLHLDSVQVDYPQASEAIDPSATHSAAAVACRGASTGPTPTASTCDDSFQARAILRYYGAAGRVQGVWKVDGIVVATQEYDLPGSEERHDLGSNPCEWPAVRLASQSIYSPELPIEKVGTFSVSVTFRIIPSAAQLDLTSLVRRYLGIRSQPTGCGSDTLSSQVLMQLVHQAPSASGGTQLRLGALNPSSRSLAPGAQPVAFLSAGSAIGGSDSSSPTGPPYQVTSKPAPYSVTESNPDAICRLVFPTKDGDFLISDLAGHVQRDGDAFSGCGLMRVKLTASSTGAVQTYPVPVLFDHWRADEKAGNFYVVDGTALNVNPKQQKVLGPGLSGALTRLQGVAGDHLNATLSLSPKDQSLNLPASGHPAPHWTAAAPLSVDGDWYSGGQSLPRTLIGSSRFEIHSDDVALDLSVAQGQPGHGACGDTGGPSWVGVDLGTDARLKPYTLDLVAGTDMDESVDNWVINDRGLCGEFHRNLGFHADLDDGWIEIGKVDAVAKEGTLTAIYQMRAHIPWLEADLEGPAQLKQGGKIAFSLSSPPLERQFGPIHMTVSDLEFTQEEKIGWTALSNASFDFGIGSSQFTTIDVPELFFGFDGHAYFAQGKTSRVQPLGGSAMLGKTPVDLKSVDIRTSGGPKDLLLFGFHTQSHLSKKLPGAEMQVDYAVQKGSFLGTGPKTSPFEVPASFPSGNPVVDGVIRPAYQLASGEDTRFEGTVDMGLFGGPPIKAEFVLGYQGSGDYWLIRGRYTLSGDGTSLVPPYLNLYSIQGGLGYNYPLTAFENAGSIFDIKPSMDGNFLFMAGMGIGSPDHAFAFYLDGRLTIKPTGADAGARMDFDAWLMSNDHSGNGDWQGFLQYSNSSFDGQLWGGMGLLGGALQIRAPKGAVAMHFADDNWFIHVGKKSGPRVQAHLLIADGDGYMMLGSEDGLQVGGGIHINLNGGLGKIEGGVETGMAVLPGPRVEGSASGNVKASVCAFGVCIGPSIDVDVKMSALPVDLRCHACIGFDLGLTKPEACGNFHL